MAMLQWGGDMARRMMSAYRMPISISSSSSAASELTVCGRGDKRTKRGKIFKGTYGNARPKRKDMIQRIKDKVEVPRSTPWPLPFKLM